MDYPARCEPSGRCCDSLASRQPIGVLLLPELLAFSQNLRPPSAMNRPIDPTAAQQRVVGGVDDGIDDLIGYVALYEGDSRRVAPPHVLMRCTNPSQASGAARYEWRPWFA
jgi:hypothetical protein